MKKNRIKEIPYNKKTILKAAINFLDSDQKVIILKYNGKELNSFYGLTSDLKKVKIPFKYTLKYLIKIFIQIPVLRIIRGFNGKELKNRIYRMFGTKIGKKVFISPGARIDEVFPELISIGDGSIIGQDVNILGHELTIKHARFGRVKIGKQVTIGTNSIIRSGVSIGDGAVVSMGSLVNKDVPAKTEVGGVPARIIKKLRKII